LATIIIKNEAGWQSGLPGTLHTTTFLTNKVVVIGSGIDTVDDGVIPSCEQVAFSPECVHIRFSEKRRLLLSYEGYFEPNVRYFRVLKLYNIFHHTR
jgi:hypothetical protein